MNKITRAFASLFTAALAAGTVSASAADAWQPSRSVEFVVPSGPGAALDTAARKMADLMQRSKLIAEPMVISNRSGAAGSIALQVLQQHPGDAHWLSTFTSGMINARVIGGVAPTYDEFTPIAVVLEESIVVAVRADSSLKTARDLVNKLKAQPNSLPVRTAARRMRVR